MSNHCNLCDSDALITRLTDENEGMMIVSCTPGCPNHQMTITVAKVEE